jgi:hypothetical protein
MRQRSSWLLATTVAAVIGTIPTAHASPSPSINLSGFSDTAVGGGVYDWSLDWSLSGFSTSALVTVTISGFPGAGICNPLIGSSGTCSGIALSSSVSGTVSATDGWQSASATFSGSATGPTTSMPEPSLSFYLTLGLGMLGIVVSRNRFTKRVCSSVPST